MAKKIEGYIKLQVKAGQANPSPPIGPALGQRGLNIMEFCKAFNAATQKMEAGTPIPVVITAFSDRSFTFKMKTPPASFFLKKAAKIEFCVEDAGPRRSRRFGDDRAVPRNRRDQDRGSQREGSRSGNEDYCRFRPFHGPAGCGVRAMSKAGKRIDKAREGIDVKKAYTLDDAVKLVKERATAKFDETIEVAIALGVDPRHADQMVRGVCALPNGSGRTVRVAVFAKGDKADAALKAGADIVGAEDLAETILSGKVDFDRCIATPDMMPLVGRLGKVLGPRGLMPNPKVGTVTPDVAEAVKAAKGGAIEFRVEKAGIVQAGVGKASFTEDQIAGNIRALIDAVQKAKPAGAKGTYIKKIAISSTMGPGLKVDTASIAAA